MLQSQLGYISLITMFVVVVGIGAAIGVINYVLGPRRSTCPLDAGLAGPVGRASLAEAPHSSAETREFLIRESARWPSKPPRANRS
jgi:hypothetical protein